METVKKHIQLLRVALTEAEAADRLKRYGKNEFPRSQEESYFARVLGVLREPMLLLLFATGGVYLVMGEIEEGALLGFSALLVVGISLAQNIKAKRALDALLELSSPRALVVRSNGERRIPASELVPGDLILLSEGDRVPADCLVVETSNLSVDESLLTGEAFSIVKSEADLDISDGSYEQIHERHKVFAATLVVRGRALAHVVHTGVLTEFGKIGQSLARIENGPTFLAKEIRQLVKVFAIAGLSVCIGVVIAFGVLRGDWLQALLAGLAIQMSLLPEEFPVIFTIFMAMGAFRLSKVQMLVRRPQAIERLGAISALCVDKTGTLTQNRMVVAALATGGEIFKIPSNDKPTKIPLPYGRILEQAILASHKNPFDPMEKALWQLAEQSLEPETILHPGLQMVREYPLSDKLFAMTCVWNPGTSSSFVAATKGAPEVVAHLCGLNDARQRDILKVVHEMAGMGLRVIGVAKVVFNEQDLPETQPELAFEWVGLVGLEDPIRSEVPNAIESCRRAGVRVIMMTGDYPQTALQIAKKAGLDTREAVISGSDLESLSEPDLQSRLATTHVFARIRPEQKLRIVKILKDMGHVVGMTGDGVNDAPSLKFADVGIAMGSRGTDVAREASDLVLLDDNFATIVAGIERGRSIFNNIRKAMAYISAIHVPIAGFAILPILLGWPIILFPAHIVFLELIIDPACSLLFESQAIEKNVMQEPPRVLKTRLFSLRDLVKSFFQGMTILVAGLVIFGWALAEGMHPAHARALSFSFLILCNLGLIIADLTGGRAYQLRFALRQKLNWAILGGALCFLFLVDQVPFFQHLFQLGSLTLDQWIKIGAMATLLSLCIAIWNRIDRRQS